VLKCLSMNYRTLLCFHFIPKFGTHACSRFYNIHFKSIISLHIYKDVDMSRWINPVNFTDIKTEWRCIFKLSTSAITFPLGFSFCLFLYYIYLARNPKMKNYSLYRYYKSLDDNYSTSKPIYYTHTSPNKLYTKRKKICVGEIFFFALLL